MPLSLKKIPVLEKNNVLRIIKKSGRVYVNRYVSEGLSCFKGAAITHDLLMVKSDLQQVIDYTIKNEHVLPF